MARRKQRSSPESLPQVAATWLVANRPLRIWIAPPDETPQRPFITLILNTETGAIQYSDIISAPPSAEQVLEGVMRAMQRPPKSLRQKPHRPRQIQIETSETEFFETLQGPLEQLQIRVSRQAHLPAIDEVIEDLENHLRGRPEHPGLLSVAQATPAMIGRLFAAAAEFYRAEPWVKLVDTQTLAVQVSPETVPRFVHVMGNGGVEYGLAMYRRWEDVERIFGFADHPSELMPPDGGHSFSFSDITLLPFDDYEAIQQYGWEVADEQAYPLPMVYTREGEVRRPEMADLHWYEAALRAIPRFVEHHLQPGSGEDYRPAEATLTVPTYAGESTVHIKYPAGDLPLDMRPVDMGDWPDFDDEAGEGDSFPMFDRRAMEGLLGFFSPEAEDPALQAAQQLMYQAWEATNPAQRIILAHEALEKSPDCADAYVLLAEEEADTLGRALEYYQKGLEAGERALGQDFFEENKGYFWGLLETRPYMRARLGVANLLWELGRPDEAAGHYRAMLELNPGDNQGVRYSLLNLLVSLERDGEAQALLDMYEEDAMAEWLYTRALVTFRQTGPGRQAETALREALATNPHVPVYLTGRKRVPGQLPAMLGWGDENEAILYAAGYLSLWRRTPGAVEWLKNRAGAPAKARGPARRKGSAKRGKRDR